MIKESWFLKIIHSGTVGLMFLTVFLLLSSSGNGSTNLAPQLTYSGSPIVSAGDTLVLTVTATDPDSGDTVYLDVVGLPANATFSQTPGNPAEGFLEWTPDMADLGMWTVAFTALDDGDPPLSSDLVVTITVTAVDTTPPEVEVIPLAPLTPSGPLTFYFVDESLDGMPGTGDRTASGAVQFVVTGTDNVTPPENLAIWSNPASGSPFLLGNNTVVATVTDVAGNSSTVEFTVAIRNMGSAAPDANNPPTFVTDGGNMWVEFPGGIGNNGASLMVEPRYTVPTVTAIPAKEGFFLFGLPQILVFDIDAEGDTTPGATVCIIYDPMGMSSSDQENAPVRFLHNGGTGPGSWSDITNGPKNGHCDGFNPPPGGGTVCGGPVESFDSGTPPQIVTEDLNTLTPEALVQRLLGGGLVVSNVTYTGYPDAAGVFDGGTGILGFESGIILSTGRVQDVVGPNSLDYTTFSFETPGDPDLDSLIPGYFTFDAAVLEFDVDVPDGITAVAFRYVFASEEYNEYVNSIFNNVFGFFVNGENYALLPDGVTAVSINNVNGGNSEECFDLSDNDGDGQTDGDDPDCYAPLDNIVGELNSNSLFFINNDCSDPDGLEFGCPINIEADGLTVVLDFVAPVDPGTTNHIKLAIADAGDSILDSWVFVEAGSLVGGITESFDLDTSSQTFVFDPENLIVEVTFEQVNELFDLTLAALEVDPGDANLNDRLGEFFPDSTCIPLKLNDQCVIIRALNPPSSNRDFAGSFDLVIKYLDEGTSTNPRVVHDPDSVPGDDFTEDITSCFIPELQLGTDCSYCGRGNIFSDFLIIDLNVPETGYFEGFLRPLDSDGLTFKAGRTIPATFRLRDFEGNPIEDAVAHIAVGPDPTGVGCGDMGEWVDTDASGEANTDNIFRYDPVSQQYIYNLSTKGYAPGCYSLTVTSNPFMFYPKTIHFGLR